MKTKLISLWKIFPQLRTAQKFNVWIVPLFFGYYVARMGFQYEFLSFLLPLILPAVMAYIGIRKGRVWHIERVPAGTAVQSEATLKKFYIVAAVVGLLFTGIANVQDTQSAHLSCLLVSGVFFSVAFFLYGIRKGWSLVADGESVAVTGSMRNLTIWNCILGLLLLASVVSVGSFFEAAADMDANAPLSSYSTGISGDNGQQVQP